MAWSERAKEVFEERKEYREENGEKDRYEKDGNTEEKKAATGDTKSGDWTDRDYTDTIKDIRNGDWEKGRAAIIKLRDHIKGLVGTIEDLTSRNAKLAEDNAAMLESLTLQEVSEVKDDVKIDEKEMLEDIDPLWSTD